MVGMLFAVWILCAKLRVRTCADEIGKTSNVVVSMAFQLCGEIVFIAEWDVIYGIDSGEWG